MNIKQKLTWAFAIIACLPVVLVATLVVLNLRSDAKDNFIDGSGREIRQVSNAMQLFFDGISQNVEYLANQPLVKTADASVKSRVSADAAKIPDTEIDTKLFDLFAALAASHPAYSYVSYGLASGGYVEVFLRNPKVTPDILLARGLATEVTDDTYDKRVPLNKQYAIDEFWAKFGQAYQQYPTPTGMAWAPIMDAYRAAQPKTDTDPVN